jgi:hypothetical protein
MNKLKQKQPEFVSQVVTQKTFNYSCKGVTLNFALMVDDDKQVKGFIKCLEKALIDVKEVAGEM